MNIYKMIECNDVISFDMFDTLVKRKVNDPRDIFRLLENEFNLEFKCSNNVFNDRVLSEKKCIQKYGIKYSLNDIYNEISLKYSKKQITFLKNKEIELEKWAIYRNDGVKKIYDYAKKLNKKIILTSDMYIDKINLKKILASVGYEFDKYYISCEEKKSKYDGSIYELIRNENKNFKLLHIGDNKKSDIQMARKYGLNTYHIKKEKKSDNFPFSIINGLADSYINNNVFCTNGYKYFGPYLFGLCKWIHENKIKYNLNILLFLSRDGQIMKEVYDILYPKENTKYFYASRRALLVPTLSVDASFDNIKNSFSFEKKTSMAKILNILGINNLEIENQYLKKFNKSVEYEMVTSDFFNNKDIIEFYNIYLFDLIKQNATTQLKNITKYFNDETDKCDNIGIIDIGWFGNMQNSLQKIFPHKKFFGMYCGMLSSDTNKIGFLYDSKKSLKYFYYERYFNSVFELIFSANHPTVLGYKLDDKSKMIKPNFGIYELDDLSKEKIFSFQRGAIDFNKDIIKFQNLLNGDFDYCKKLINYLGKMDSYSLKEFGKIEFLDFEKRKLISENYKNSLWKLGYLRVKWPKIDFIKYFYFYSKIKYKFKK